MLSLGKTEHAATIKTLSAVIAAILCCLGTALPGVFGAQASQGGFQPRLVLQHRLDSASPSAWTVRGYITIQNATAASFEPVQRVADLMRSSPNSAGKEESVEASATAAAAAAAEAAVKSSEVEGAYLLRLVREGNEAVSGEDARQVVTTKQCLLETLVPGSLSSDVLSLIFPSEQSLTSSVPVFSYSIVGLPALDAMTQCPRRPIPRRGGMAASREPQLKVLVGVREQVIGASLRAAPRPRADGTVGAEVPPPEKNFLQKYWFCGSSILDRVELSRRSNNG